MYKRAPKHRKLVQGDVVYWRAENGVTRLIKVHAVYGEWFAGTRYQDPYDVGVYHGLERQTVLVQP